MHILVSYTVVAAMALHTLLGCCFHHAHAHDATSDCAHSDSDCSSHDEQGCGEHQHLTHDERAADDAATPSHEPSAPTPCSDSCEGKCQFVSTSRVQLESPVAVHDAWLVTAQPVVVVDESAYLSFETRRSTVPPLPIPLHLWNGLLLI